MTDKAFPLTVAIDRSGETTKREHFAALVAQGLAAKTTLSSPDDYRALAESATRLADAIISALNVGIELTPTVAERRAAKLAEEEAQEEAEKAEKAEHDKARRR